MFIHIVWLIMPDSLWHGVRTHKSEAGSWKWIEEKILFEYNKTVSSLA